MFVPIVRITIQKKSDSVTFAPAYALPLYKLLWRDKCTKVTVSRITDPHLNPMMQVIELPGLDAIESEEKRLMKLFGVKLFYTVYPGESFKDAFAKVAVETNAWKDKNDKQKEDAMKRARAESRTVVIAQ